MRSLLALYILHTLKERPKSGYEMRKEIGAKTSGFWNPSKCTLYPHLQEREREELIVVVATERRSKTLYSVTQKGLETLTIARERDREHQRKMVYYKDLITTILGGADGSMKELLQEIKRLVDGMPPGREREFMSTLEDCRVSLRRMVSHARCSRSRKPDTAIW